VGEISQGRNRIDPEKKLERSAREKIGEISQGRNRSVQAGKKLERSIMNGT
jgi:hypothetical protein